LIVVAFSIGIATAPAPAQQSDDVDALNPAGSLYRAGKDASPA